MRRSPYGKRRIKSADECLRRVARYFFSFLALGSFLTVTPPALAATYYVSPSGNNANSGISLTLAKQTIQAAINVAVDGDTVLVADGTYAPITIGKGITVRSLNGAQTTIINGGGTMRCVYMYNAAAVLDGFTVTQGYAPNYGGGVYAYRGIVKNCTINGNRAYYHAGGIYAYCGTVENCTISGNTILYYYGYAGGIFAYQSTVQNCTITGNSAYLGGGAVLWGSDIIQNCAIKGNTAGYIGGVAAFYNDRVINCRIEGNTGYVEGGGLYVENSSATGCTVTKNTSYRRAGGIWSWHGAIENCTIISNTAYTDGGGLFLADSDIVKNCTIRKNIALLNGGGAMVQWSTIENCLIEENESYGSTWTTTYYDCGGGVYVLAGGRVRNCAINRNLAYWDGGGAFLFGGLLENCTLEGNSAYSFGGGISIVSGTARNCLVTGGKAGDMGGGVWAMGGLVENCTISGNSVFSENGQRGLGGGVYLQAGAARNCVVYYNEGQDVIAPNLASISYSCLELQIPGTGNTTNAPQFVSNGAGYGARLVPGNYRLRSGSPGINTGINQSWMIPPSGIDLDGRGRVCGGLVDMGAYELHTDPGILQFNPASYQVNEGAGTVTLTVTRTRGSFGPATVDYATADGSALAGSDYTLQSGTLSWADGDSSSKTITISISDDLLIENAETFTATLSNAQGASLGPASLATVTITDNESGQVQFSIPSYEVNEDAGTVTLVVTRTGGSFGPASVEYVTSDGTASAGSDYTIQSGTLSWANGDASSKTITVAITDDSLDESDETFTVTLSNAQGAGLGPANLATVTILDNDEPSSGILQFAVTYVEVNEDGGSATLTVIRTGGSFGPASVDYTAADGTASAGSDYTLQSGTLSWADGDASSKTITVAIIDDSLDENDETLTLTLSNAQGAGLGPANLATVTILDNDVPPREDLVDLEVSGFKFVPVNLWAGDNPAEIEFDLVNEGPGDLGTVGTQLEISFYLSVNMTLGDEDDIAIGTKIEVLELAAGSQTTIRYPGRAHNTDITIPEGLSGDYYVFLSIHVASSTGLYDLDGASAMREGPIRVRIQPSGGGGGGGGSGGGGNSQQQRIVANDYDGDGQDDLTSYDEASGDWAVQLSRSAQLVEFVFGGPGYESVAADYDGDSLADPAIHQRNGPAWQIMLSGQGYAAVNFNLGGAGGTQGAVGDYLGAGQANPGLYEEQSGRWYVLTSPVGAENVAIASAVFGGPGWTSVVGDYDGDGRADPALYEEATGNWLIMLSALGYGVVSADLGGPGSRPVPGDYDGDGKTDLAIMDASGGWYYRLSSRGYATSGPDNFGQTGQPAPGDYDGDGKSDPAVVSATGDPSIDSGQSWYIWHSGSSYTRVGPYSLTQ